MYKKIKKIIPIFLLISIIICICFITKHINHECNHNNCPICLIINNLKNIKTNNINIIIIPFYYFVIKQTLNTFKINDKKKYTLFGLKVELIN